MDRRRVLILSSVASIIDQFNMNNIKLLIDMGYEVHVACNFIEGNTCSDEQIAILKENLIEWDVKFHQVDFKRNVLRLVENIRAYNQVHKLSIRYGYRFIHCHSPIGGVVGRMIGYTTKVKVIYTAHGFHFFKGAPIKNWLIFYPIEKWLSRYTDVLITINKEDYERAKRKFYAKKIEYIPGVGVNTKKFTDCLIDRNKKREALNVPDNGIIVLSVGELVKRKNHGTIIRAIAQTENNDIYYFICGKGELEDELNRVIHSLNLENRVFLLGFRDDIPELCKAADVYAFPSTREGLGLAGIEGMAAGLPIVSTHINGIKDYTIDGKTGYCEEPYDVKNFAKAIEKLAKDKELRDKIGEYNVAVAKKFDISNVNLLMRGVYSSGEKMSRY